MIIEQLLSKSCSEEDALGFSRQQVAVSSVLSFGVSQTVFVSTIPGSADVPGDKQ